MKTALYSTAAVLAGLTLTPTAFAADATADAARILASPAFKAAATSIDNEYQRIVDEGIKLTEIPAPPFKEEKRGKEFAAMVKAAGLADVKIDPEGNVIALRKGTKGDGKFVVVSAHLDTVFPEGTDVKVKRQGTKLMAPGIGDDTFSLATLLAQIRAMQTANIKTRDDILFVGTVGEEGQGDLRGVRYLFTKGEYKGKIKAFFSIESGDVANITNGGVGSRRYRVTFKGPGGHSYGAFGLVNPMYALSTAATEFSRLQVPTSPKTTYGIGVIGGGTSVNSIPLEAWMEIDMRSEAVPELKRVEERMMSIMQSAADSENFNRSTKEGRITVETKLIGDRPAGNTDAKAELVQQAAAAIVANGYKVDYQWSSTDSNIPMNLGVPAITIGRSGPGKGGRAHSLDEWVDVEKGPMIKAAQTGLSIILTATGME